MHLHKLASALLLALALAPSIVVAQEATMQRARDKQALQRLIDKAKDGVSRYKAGRVIVGQVVVEEGDDPALVESQMFILDDGTFASPILDLNRPIRFRMHQYAPYDLELVGKSGDLIDVGVIKMKSLPDRQLVPIKGRVILEDSGDPKKVEVSLSVDYGAVNSPSNGSEPRLRWSEPVVVPVSSHGQIDLGGFSPVEYYCTLAAPVYITKGIRISFRPKTGADLGNIELEKSRRVVIEYVTSKDGHFDAERIQKVELNGGERWKATPDIYGWDLNSNNKTDMFIY